MQARRNLAVLEHEHRFDQAGDAGRSFQVAEIRFHRADGQRRIGRAILAKRLGQRVRLDRIADRGAGAVRFDKSDLRRRDSGVLAGVAHQPRLRLGARERDAVGVAVLIHRRADDHPVDRVAVRDRLREPLQQHHARAFAADEAVRRGVERLALAVRREHRGLRKSDETAGRDHHRHAAGERRIAAARPNVFARRVHRGQRGRARGVHRDARSAQIEAIGDAVGGDAVRAAGRRVRR